MMMRPPRPLWTILSTCALWLFAFPGCDDSPSPGDPDAGIEDSGTPDASTPDSGPEDAGTADAGSEDAGTPDAGPEDAGTPDAGPYVWDGTYVEQEDLGDWTDTGPRDTCRFLAENDPSPTACESLEGFDLSSCDMDALAGLEQRGIYRGWARSDRVVPPGEPARDGSGRQSVGFRLFDDGTPDTQGSNTVIQRQTRDGKFYLVSQRTHPVTGTVTLALAGCHVPRPGVITGCFVNCSTKGFYSRNMGTFEVHRLAWSGREAESSGGLKLVSELSTPVGLPVDVFVTQEHAYVVSDNRSPRVGGLSVFDVRDRKNPVLKTTLSLPGDTSWNGVWAHGNALYIASNVSGVVVYDISQPDAPTFVRVLTADFGVHTVLVDGERLYAMSPSAGTFVYDVSTPLEPRLVTLINLPEEFSIGGPHDAFAYQGRLHISNAYSGYSVVDVTNLEDARHLGQYSHYGFTFSHHSAVGTFGGRTIAFVGGEFEGSYVRVLDTSDPARIPKLGEFRMRAITSMHNLLLRGNLLYVAWYHEGLRVLDVSNPTQPRQVAHFNTFRETDPYRIDGIFDGAFGVRIPGDGHVYVVDSSRGLIILNEL
ncbi:LVIVD repeat-containing protein [Myxococcus qinghaiensis]|uniref:LVIVD repeat-containing protein n=1 Tax=Myxococcus qinghaiensis TaxID=2906758 RepID=UPI00225DF75F|nr:hypothetical protein [Myxococcus qinghaiensis]